MADYPFNVGKGRILEYVNKVNDNNPTNSALILLLLEAEDTQGVLEDLDDVAAVLANGSTTEATFPGYSRQVMDDVAIGASTVDDTNNWANADFPDQVFSPSSNGNALTGAVLAYDPDTTTGTDSSIIPLIHWDFVTTPNAGADITAQPATEGFVRST